ncbi:sigma 54-interacting transcriptional regulator [Brevibacillus ginsengisoli]|uniref:sigma-54-dependent Fis family transcriptional regulator n=1 Tax=Brevibacillus ginsengisoli TaxID=363854 RepID=UPI003CE68A07
MSVLQGIQDTVQQVAEAISAALQIECEIVDDTMTIIAGTGAYKERINTKEENGQVDAGYLYGRVISNNQAYFIEDARSDPSYDPSVLVGQTEELAELCAPINYEGKVIGVIGLIAFDEVQHQFLLKNKLPLFTFLQRMSDLMTEKLTAADAFHNWKRSMRQLEVLIESIHEGIIAIDEQGVITTCNQAAQELIQQDKSELIGKKMKDVWPNSPMLNVLHSHQGYLEQEEIYTVGGHQMHLMITARPILIDKKTAGVVATFRRMADMRRLAYSITGETKDLLFTELKGNSRSLSLVLKQAQQVARGTSNILITGESGTGKGMMAAAIHSASNRRDGPFIIVNCGAIPETLLESELFGYAGGAFTGAKKEGKAGKFELADGGTIFLDEIGDLPLHLQVKLLHVLQSKQVERVGSNQLISVNVRVISATNKSLEEMVEMKEFRADLYFRLNVIPLHMPPLRERAEDILLLMDYFLAKYKENTNPQISCFTHEVKQLFLHYEWPGNVRELENAIEYAVNMETSSIIGLDAIPLRIKQYLHSSSVSTSNEKGSILELSLKDQLKQQEVQIILRMLERYGTTLEAKRTIAEKLEIGLATLYRKLESYSIS